MDLVHYSDDLIEKFEKRDYTEVERWNDKPRGFWVSDDSCEDNWKWWCESTDFRTECLKLRYKVSLKESHTILILTTATDIFSFTEHYNARTPYLIDWERVKKDYQGIIITPYWWNLRHLPAVHWYYTWDCASGCIWDLSCIEIELDKEYNYVTT